MLDELQSEANSDFLFAGPWILIYPYRSEGFVQIGSQDWCVLQSTRVGTSVHWPLCKVLCHCQSIRYADGARNAR